MPEQAAQVIPLTAKKTLAELGLLVLLLLSLLLVLMALGVVVIDSLVSLIFKSFINGLLFSMV